MKKLLISLLCAISICASEAPEFTIVDYKPEFKDAIREIASQDPEQFFQGYEQLVSTAQMTRDQFLEQNLKEFKFDNPNKRTSVLLSQATVAGFITVFKAKTPNYEDVVAALEVQKQQMPPEFQDMLVIPSYEQMLNGMPGLAKTSAEAKEYGKIEGLAVAREFRKKGFGRALMAHALESIKKQGETISKIKLEVNAKNDNAKKLYESMGFAPAAPQPVMAPIMGFIEYEKPIIR